MEHGGEARDGGRVRERDGRGRAGTGVLRARGFSVARRESRAVETSRVHDSSAEGRRRRRRRREVARAADARAGILRAGYLDPGGGRAREDAAVEDEGRLREDARGVGESRRARAKKRRARADGLRPDAAEREIPRGARAHTIGVRRGPSARRAAAARRNPSPGPGAYENGPRPIGASNVAKLQKGVVLGARPPDRKAAADADAPAPGEYYPDGDGDDARKKSSSRGPNLGRATGHDAPGGALDAATRAGRTPGPGEFYDETTDARRGARGRATTISRTGHDAYGGFMDVARLGGETPGPGEFYSAGGRRGTTPVRIGRTTGHDAPGGAIRRVLYTGPHTTALAW